MDAVVRGSDFFRCWTVVVLGGCLFRTTGDDFGRGGFGVLVVLLLPVVLEDRGGNRSGSSAGAGGGGGGRASGGNGSASGDTIQSSSSSFCMKSVTLESIPK